jgi:hypothetical protein
LFLPGSLARQPCNGSLARQPCPAAMLGSLTWHLCSAALHKYYKFYNQQNWKLRQFSFSFPCNYNKTLQFTRVRTEVNFSLFLSSQASNLSKKCAFMALGAEGMGTNKLLT